MSGQWRHDDKRERWELGAVMQPDPARGHREWLPYAMVTDEMITRVASPAFLAARMFNSLGSVPPPLAEYLPPDDPTRVVYE